MEREVWIDCSQCGGEGVIDGDCTCGDDTCCCLYPDPPDCALCEGAGGYLVPSDSDAAREAFR